MSRLELYTLVKNELARFAGRLDQCIADEEALVKEHAQSEEARKKRDEFQRNNPSKHVPYFSDDVEYVRNVGLNRGALKRGSLDLAQAVVRLRK